MSIARKAIVGTLWTSGLNYIAMGVGFVFGILRDQVLLPDENGIYMYGLAVVDILFIAAAVSFNITLIQAKDDVEDLYSTAFVLTIFLSALMLVLASIVALGMHLRGTLEIKVQVFLLLAGFSALNLFTILFTAFLEKQIEYKRIARMNLLSVLSFPLVSYVLVLNGWGAWGMAWGYCASFIVSFVGMSMISRYPVGLKFNPTTAMWFLSMGWKLIFSRGLEVLFVRYGTLVTERMLGTSLQGSYGRALKYWELAPQTVAPAVVTVALPTYSRLQDEREKLSHAFTLVLYFLVRALIPFVLVFCILAESFINILGPQWRDAVPVLQILSVGALLAPIFENMKQLLYAKGEPGKMIKVRLIQLVVFIPAMYLFILSYGISGAAIAIVLNYTIGVTATFLIVRRFISVRWVSGLIPPIVFGSLAGFVAVQFPLWDLMNGAFVQFTGECLYVVGMYLFLEGVFERRKLNEYFQFIRQNMKNEGSPS